METQSLTSRRWLMPLVLALITGFAVFVLPYFFPPPPIQGISAANIAGFNNKVAAIAAAAISFAVFLLALRRNPLPSQPVAGAYARISTRSIALATILAVLPVAVFCWMITRSHHRYLGDTYYFLHQLSMSVDYGRKLYAQIEFPYGPLLFYFPIALHGLLKHLGVSLLGSLLTALVILHVVGFLTVAWAINTLRILHRWRVALLTVAAIYVFQPNFAPNHCYFRFFTPAACVIFLAQQKTRGRFFATASLAQMFCLAISAEMGFAFFFAAGAITLWLAYADARSWLLCLLAPVLGVPAFLLLVGKNYLLIFSLFAGGVENFVVEPQPYALIYLFELIWLVPLLAALYLRQRHRDAAMISGLYVFSLALVPVAFGRADAGHVYWNGIAVVLLSFVAICHVQPSKQTVWAVISLFVLSVHWANRVSDYRNQLKTVVNHTLFGRNAGAAGRAVADVLRRVSPATLERQQRYASLDEGTFDLPRLEHFTHGQTVILPLEPALIAEEELKRAGQLAPTYTYFQTGTLDRTSELREVAELHQYNWVLLPADHMRLTRDDGTPGRISFGLKLPWELHREPYTVGYLLYEELDRNWVRVADIDGHILYRRKDVPPFPETTP